MATYNERINFIVNILDKKFGFIRMMQGKKNIGKLESLYQGKRAFFLMAPSYGNIGDQAIVEATLCFWKDYFPEYFILKIDYDETLQYIKEIKRVIKKDDIIVLQGGGNVGTLYYDAEIVRQNIIKSFPNFKIILMPQSFYFDPKAQRELEKSAKIYNSHRNLTVIARDHFSYENMKRVYNKCNVIINPDIVFYYSKYIEKIDLKFHRENIICCLRHDTEDLMGNKKTELLRKLYNHYSNLIVSDTCVPRRVPDELRMYEIHSMLQLFSNAKVVLTDRLHGMIFAALTNTPCIVLPSKDTKILGTYEWIRDLTYIYFVETDEVMKCIDLVNSIITMNDSDFGRYSWEKFRDKYYKELSDKIRG